MGSEAAPKPIVGSQRFRIVESICQEIAEKLDKKPDDFFTIFQARLSQLVDTSVPGQPDVEQPELWKPVVDAAVFMKGPGGVVAGSPVLLVFLDRDASEYKRAITHLDRTGHPYLFSTEEAIVRKGEKQSSVEFQTPAVGDRTAKNKPFNRSENQILTALSAAIIRGDFSNAVLLTGQTVLGTFTDFSGYTHDQYGNQTDSDLLLCTAPPVSIPLLAIEVDGPLHFSEEAHRQVRSQQQAQRNIEKERQKTKEKDEAFKKAGIPVLHIRVDKSAKNVFDRHANTLARLIGKLIKATDAQEYVIAKKRHYLDSVVEQFSMVRQKTYATHPELEDLIYIAPEIINWLLRNLKETDTQARSLQDQLDAIYMDQPPSTPEDAYGYPIAEQYELIRLQELNLDQLFGQISCSVELPTEREGSTDTIDVRIAYHSKLGPSLELASFKETVPWLEVGGHNSHYLNQVLRQELASMLGYSYYVRLSTTDKESLQSRILGHLSTLIELAEDASRLLEIRVNVSAYKPALLTALGSNASMSSTVSASGSSLKMWRR